MINTKDVFTDLVGDNGDNDDDSDSQAGDGQVSDENGNFITLGQ